ncbi:sporulation protein YqfD [Falsibacillus albus]|uniref:Sporulation protein YqfD n=1 Tax=Falsibacillus albus TaxID=2478915 RepID=A0A3L7K5R7_9BACI|nr:sporulation protein YqfD [Falsibacillus albus]RLQ98180.1 sporulation protein YqfD [Falsibacillus albus]
MKNHWVTFFGGAVRVKVEGTGLERFINKLTRSHLIIWNLKRHGTQTITFMMALKDIHKLRSVKKSTDCKITFLRGEGVPFLWKRTLKNAGFLFGIILFFLLITLLSNVVWRIDIKGASPQTEHKIRKELDRIGVQVGKLQFFVRDVDSIQKELTDNLKNITWVGVDLKGATYHFQVVEKNEPKPGENTGYQNLIAKKKAVIVDMYVEEGQSMVHVNDYVQKGQTLVSGIIGKDKTSKAVASKGEIWGETWYKSQVEVPITSQFSVLTGDEIKRHSLKFWGWRVPIWGFGKNNMKDFEKDEQIHTVKFLKWEMPISYIQTIIREKETGTRTYSEEEAIKAGKILALNDLKSKLDNDAKIKGEKVLHEKVENGKVKLSIYFQVIENIAVGQPIIQGD